MTHGLMHLQPAHHRRNRHDEDTATLEKDLLINLLVVFLLLLGGHALLAGARSARPSASGLPQDAVEVFIEADGTLHLESLCAAAVGLEAVDDAIRDITTQSYSPKPIVIYYPESTQAGVVHHVLQRVNAYTSVPPLLALSHYVPSACRQEANQ